MSKCLKEGILLYETEIAGPPTTLALLNNTGGFNGREVLYGTSDGKIGVLEMSLEEPISKWELQNDKRLGGVACLSMYDITCDGILDLLIGREDGTIQVYSYNVTDELTLKFTYVSLNRIEFDLNKRLELFICN